MFTFTIATQHVRLTREERDGQLLLPSDALSIDALLKKANAGADTEETL